MNEQIDLMQVEGEVVTSEAVLTTTVDDGNYKAKLVYLNKQNRNTVAALKRIRSKVFHKWGTTYNVGKNAAKRAKREAAKV